MWAIVPCKHLSLAKSRLSSVLSADERQQLSIAMATDVLFALTRTPDVEGIVVVSDDPTIAEIAQSFGAKHLHVDSGAGLTSACHAASERLVRDNVSGTITVASDLPLANTVDIEQILSALDETAGVTAGIVIAPDRRNSGTNVLAMRPASAIPYSFGKNSFAKHRRAASKVALAPRIVRSHALGLDIDTEEDLIAFARNPSATHAFQFVAQSEIHDRLLLEPDNYSLTFMGHG